jgi:hypothetical protein
VHTSTIVAIAAPAQVSEGHRLEWSHEKLSRNRSSRSHRVHAIIIIVILLLSRIGLDRGLANACHNNNLTTIITVSPIVSRHIINSSSSSSRH